MLLDVYLQTQPFSYTCIYVYIVTDNLSFDNTKPPMVSDRYRCSMVTGSNSVLHTKQLIKRYSQPSLPCTINYYYSFFTCGCSIFSKAKQNTPESMDIKEIYIQWWLDPLGRGSVFYWSGSMTVPEPSVAGSPTPPHTFS